MTCGIMGEALYEITLTPQPSQLADRIKIPGGSAGIVLADAQRGVVDEAIGRHRQIVRRWNAGEHAARRIVFRAVTGAEITARPIRHRRVCARCREEQRNAAEMRANPNQPAEL